jgi:hypothetical protein
MTADTKIVFIAFAIEDERQRDFLKAHTRHPRAPFEFVDMSVKQPYDSNWKDRVRTRIRRSHGVIALVSKNSLTSSGQKWEIQCAKEERKPLRGIGAYAADRTSLPGVGTYEWNDKNISDFIDSLWEPTTRKALIVGIDYYDRIPGLSGWVNDANAVKSVLERHADNTTNFTTPEVLLGATADSAVTKHELKEAVRELFNDDAEIALLYFAGHGYTEDTGGFCARAIAQRATMDSRWSKL